MEDQRPATYEHIQIVQRMLNDLIRELLTRSEQHDQSKLRDPEKSVFDEYTPKLRDVTYGSEEYKAALAGMKPALDHHYANNRHHPEHFEDGIHGMNLVDLLEMLVDWKAATLRHADGDIRVSIETNQERFGYGDEIKQLLLNTLPLLNKEYRVNG